MVPPSESEDDAQSGAICFIPSVDKPHLHLVQIVTISMMHPFYDPWRAQAIFSGQLFKLILAHASHCYRIL